MIIGFSLIFQFFVHWFADLMRFLRENGVSCHFTVGGHFPSLSYQRTLELMPDVDSVARFEGEVTLLELADLLSPGRDWHDVQGLAYRRASQITATPLRSLTPDLDELPYPARANMTATWFWAGGLCLFWPAEAARGLVHFVPSICSTGPRLAR